MMKVCAVMSYDGEGYCISERFFSNKNMDVDLEDVSVVYKSFSRVSGNVEECTVILKSGEKIVISKDSCSEFLSALDLWRSRHDSVYGYNFRPPMPHVDFTSRGRNFKSYE